MSNKTLLFTSRRELKYWKELPADDFISTTFNKTDSNQLSFDSKESSHSLLGIGYSFEHSSCENLMKLSADKRHNLLVNLISPAGDLRFNIWRICIGTSDFTGTDWYSYCDKSPNTEENVLEHLNKHFSIKRDFDLIIPVLKEALEINPKLLIFASPWSPPSWMKDSGTMLGGKLLHRYYSI